MGLAQCLALVAFGCQDGYPIPATQCDEWCEAYRPFACGGYDPADCVLACQRWGGDDPQCQGKLQRVLNCWQGKKPAVNSCHLSDDQQDCAMERSDFLACGASHSDDGYGSLTLGDRAAEH